MFLQWLIGLRRLGYDVLFVDWLPHDGVDGLASESAGARFLARVMEAFGLADDYCLLDRRTGRALAGIPRREAIRRARESSALLNVMGYLHDDELLDAVPRRVFVDIDPGFPQMWRELGLHNAFAGHDAFVTIGENIGLPGCEIPTCGLPWVTTRQPVVLDLWPVAKGTGRAFTSVGSWRGPYGPVEFAGQTYGLRVHEFRRFVDLPRLTGAAFELALDIHEDEVRDLALLHEKQWALVPPSSVAGDPFTYRSFISRSRAELMVAKGMYVKTGSGWFSDRSACYLASGRPVLAQDTGLDGLYPVGDGLLTFRTVGEAVEGVARIAADYRRHARAARALAAEHFDSNRVLPTLLGKLGI